MAIAPNNKMRLRMLFLMLLFTVVFSSVLIARLGYIQLGEKGEEYQREAIDQQMSALSINASRGEIKDTNGKTLAVSATVWNVVVDPSTVKAKDVDIIAENLSRILEMDKNDIRQRCLKENTRHVYIKRRIEKPQQQAIVSFLSETNINSIYLTEDTKRYYPFGSLASTVIGFVNDENVGGSGVESEYNKILSGTPGMVVSAKTALNTDLPYRYQKMYEAKNGNSLILTIDETIQHFLEKHLETAVVENSVHNRATGIIMDVNTGAILAMATTPGFDPNNFKVIADPIAQQRLDAVALASGGTDTDEYRVAKSNEQNLQWRNKSVSELYEPGSVFKIVTASAALDHGDVSLNTHFMCNGSVEVADWTIGCWKAGGHGDQDFGATLKHSCNPAFVQMGLMLGGTAFYDYFDAFGMTQGTGIDLPGEAGSLYHSKKDFEQYRINVASSAFGQTNKVTPVQMITAVAAAVNGGHLVTPYVVRQIVDSNGSVVETREPQIRRQVVSEETSKAMNKLIEGVVSDQLEGSGRNAYIPGYRIGGKTGTSQKLDQETREDGREEHVLSFTGIAPMDDPQIACLVILDNPELTNVLSSTIAVPVVKYILADVLPYIGVEPKYTPEEQQMLDALTPNLSGKSVDEAKALLAERNLEISVKGSGTAVLRQVPSASTPIPRESTVIVYTEEETEVKMVAVPDLFGLTTRQVNQLVTNAGLNLRLTGGMGGASIASHQSPAAGAEVEVGTIVEVEMTATDVERVVRIQ